MVRGIGKNSGGVRRYEHESEESQRLQGSKSNTPVSHSRSRAKLADAKAQNSASRMTPVTVKVAPKQPTQVTAQTGSSLTTFIAQALDLHRFNQSHFREHAHHHFHKLHEIRQPTAFKLSSEGERLDSATIPEQEENEFEIFNTKINLNEIIQLTTQISETVLQRNVRYQLDLKGNKIYGVWYVKNKNGKEEQKISLFTKDGAELGRGAFSLVTAVNAFSLEKIKQSTKALKETVPEMAVEAQDIEKQQKDVVRHNTIAREIHSLYGENGAPGVVSPDNVFTDFATGRIVTYGKRFDGSLSINMRRSLSGKIAGFAEVFEGLAFMHKKGFRHRDIKPGNILVKGSKFRLSDLGGALKESELRSLLADTTKTTKDKIDFVSGVHTGIYSTWGDIEAIKACIKGYAKGDDSHKEKMIVDLLAITEKADIFAMGMTMAKIITGWDPAISIGEETGYRQLPTDRDELEEFFISLKEELESEGCTSDIAEAIANMLQPIFTDRPTAQEVLTVLQSRA